VQAGSRKKSNAKLASFSFGRREALELRVRPTSGGARSPRKTQSFLILEGISIREKVARRREEGVGWCGYTSQKGTRDRDDRRRRSGLIKTEKKKKKIDGKGNRTCGVTEKFQE